MSLDDSAGRRASAPLFWVSVAALVGLTVLLFSAEGSLDHLAARLLGAAAAFGYGVGASDALVGVAVGLISACILFAITGAAFVVGYLLLIRRYPDSNIAGVVPILLVIAAAQLVGRDVLDQALTGTSQRIAHATAFTVLVAVLAAVMVPWRRDKVTRSKVVGTDPDSDSAMLADEREP